MSDLMLLDRLEEALSAPPAYEMPPPEGLEVVDQLRLQAELIVKNGKEWLNNLKRSIARARKHPLHRKEFGKAWVFLEPSLSRAIKARENSVRQIDVLLDRASHLKGSEAAEITVYAKQISLHVAEEQRSLVNLYYLLKSDADDAAEDAQPQGKPLSTPEDIRAYFKRTRAA